MSQPYVGEVRAFGFNFAPVNWAFCNGQPLAISQFDVLYAVIGTIYGGDGNTTFNVPNLQGQVPMHWGNGPGGFNTTIGQVQGVPTVTLTQAQTPSHNHVISVASLPAGGVVTRTQAPNATSYISDTTPDTLYKDTTPVFDTNFAANMLSSVGGSIPHDNMQPYLVINFCISLFGIFPSRN